MRSAILIGIGLMTYAVNPVNAAMTSGGTREESVLDPSFNMVAATFTVPARWSFVGQYFAAGNCGSIPYFVFRANSPDGLSYVEDLPRYGWSWGTGFAANVKRDEACMKLSSAISAREFLKLVSATLNVEYVSDAPVPAELTAKAREYEQQMKAGTHPPPGMRPADYSRDIAWAIVRYKNGSFTMKGRLSATVNCSTAYYPGLKSVARGVPDRPGFTSSHCDGFVRLLAAPEQRFDSTAAMLDAINVAPRANTQWLQAYMQRQQAEGNAMLDKMRRDSDARLKSQADQFAQSQAARQRMHEQFLSTMQRGTDMSMRHAADVANSNHRMASDVVDYALDRQTVKDPVTGQISKVSSAYSYTWVDSTGKTSYQTNDPNATPNGSLPGNWTRQQVVHGDGSN
jgi:hypothetical protein